MAYISLIATGETGTTRYGIRIDGPDGQPIVYPDISEREEDARRLLQRLSGDVSPVHFDDVIEDYILELAYERIRRNGIER